MRSGLTDDFRLHDVGDAVYLGGGVLIHLGHAEGFRESEDVQESDGVSTVLSTCMMESRPMICSLSCSLSCSRWGHLPHSPPSLQVQGG